MDAAAPGDKLTFLPGLHQHGLKKNRSILYVDKSVEIELMAGATLKLADNVCHKEGVGEITTDQDSGKKLDDLEIGGARFTVGPGDSFRIRGEAFQYANPYTTAAVAIWVIAPPVY